MIHKFVRDKYEKRFPELETLVPNPLEYLAAVKLLGNEINTKGQNKVTLKSWFVMKTSRIRAKRRSFKGHIRPSKGVFIRKLRAICRIKEDLVLDRFQPTSLFRRTLWPKDCDIRFA